MHVQVAVLVNVRDEIVHTEGDERRVGTPGNHIRCCSQCPIPAENAMFMLTHHQFQKHKKIKPL